MTRSTAKAKTRIQRWRLAIWLVLAAFTLQAYVTQVHIHDSATTTVTNSAANVGHGKSSGDNNPLDCPFCQAVAQAGAFALPAAPLLLLSVAGIMLAAPDHRSSGAANTLAHIWQSRAPPQK